MLEKYVAKKNAIGRLVEACLLTPAGVELELYLRQDWVDVLPSCDLGPEWRTGVTPLVTRRFPSRRIAGTSPPAAMDDAQHGAAVGTPSRRITAGYVRALKPLVPPFVIPFGYGCITKWCHHEQGNAQASRKECGVNGASQNPDCQEGYEHYELFENIPFCGHRAASKIGHWIRAAGQCDSRDSQAKRRARSQRSDHLRATCRSIA